MGRGHHRHRPVLGRILRGGGGGGGAAVLGPVPGGGVLRPVLRGGRCRVLAPAPGVAVPGPVLRGVVRGRRHEPVRRAASPYRRGRHRPAARPQSVQVLGGGGRPHPPAAARPGERGVGPGVQEGEERGPLRGRGGGDRRPPGDGVHRAQQLRPVVRGRGRGEPAHLLPDRPGQAGAVGGQRVQRRRKGLVGRPPPRIALPPLDQPGQGGQQLGVRHGPARQGGRGLGQEGDAPVQGAAPLLHPRRPPGHRHDGLHQHGVGDPGQLPGHGGAYGFGAVESGGQQGLRCVRPHRPQRPGPGRVPGTQQIPEGRGQGHASGPGDPPVRGHPGLPGRVGPLQLPQEGAVGRVRADPRRGPGIGENDVLRGALRR